MARPDPHSYFDDTQPRTAALELRLTANFDAKTLEGEATLRFDAPASGPIDLDTRSLEVAGASDDRGRTVEHAFPEEDPIVGRRLRLTLPPGTRSVTIRYRTSPDSTALQWLGPEQTAGKRHPFLFSQCQAIHARTVAPLQDTPMARIPYRAELTVPGPLTAVMSAGSAGSRPGPLPGTRTFLFEMPQPIPPYLLAIAVGELHSRDLSPRSRVWAEPGTIESAAWEFAGIEEQLRKAEELFGPYDWDRYDMIVLPPSFPYGGMENPRLTFLTPTLLAGDRSLVDVVAHELAHSWTGNLVTNATMEHFWLNEGFTTYAERRILEALHGEDAVAVSWAIGQVSLDEAIARFGPRSPLTRLRTELKGIDPDESFSEIPYEKGSRFLVVMERAVGREAFDRFLREYMERFRFTSITTEQFLAFVEERLPGLAARIDARAWIYEPGMPAGAPVFHSKRLEGIQRLAAGWSAGARPGGEVAGWSAAELQVYVQSLPRELDTASLDWLDGALGLTGRGNYEILVAWLTIAAQSGYEPAFGRIREVLTGVGRMKYLRPLYGALGRDARTRALAREAFAAARGGYHALSRRAAESVIAAYPAD